MYSLQASGNGTELLGETEIRLKRHERGKCERNGVLECTLYLKTFTHISDLYFCTFAYPRQNQHRVSLSKPRRDNLPCIVG